MKIWSTPYSDIGTTVNYNGPKVMVADCTSNLVAPHCGDADECSWLNAGIPEYLAVLARKGSDNPTSADNQQERPVHAQ